MGYPYKKQPGSRTFHLVPAQALTPGATLGLFSPSEPLIPERLTTLKKSLKLLSSQGYQITYAPNALNQGLYAAGTAAERLHDIHYLAADPNVDALLATWGGKSCNQLLSELDFDLLLQARKPVIGFSDIAVILNALTATTGLASFHFLVAGRLNETTHTDLNLLRGGDSTHDDLFDFHHQDVRLVLRDGQGTGRLFGGNLSTFVLGLLGTRFMPLADDIVFFWESASERPLVIDQHLTSLRNAGFFENVRAMIIGSVYSHGELRPSEISEAVDFSIRDYSFPVIYSPSFGHLPTQNPVIPIGGICSVDTSTFSAKLVDTAVVS